MRPLSVHRLSWEQRKQLHERLTRRAVGLHGEASPERADIDAALARLETAAFGACSDCGAPIAWDRLLDEPELRWCSRCQRAHEAAATPPPRP